MILRPTYRIFESMLTLTSSIRGSISVGPNVHRTESLARSQVVAFNGRPSNCAGGLHRSYRVCLRLCMFIVNQKRLVFSISFFFKSILSKCMQPMQKSQDKFCRRDKTHYCTPDYTLCFHSSSHIVLLHSPQLSSFNNKRLESLINHGCSIQSTLPVLETQQSITYKSQPPYSRALDDPTTTQ